jgi:predicted esterase
MFRKKILVETITVVLIVSILPAVICENQCTEYGDPPRKSTFSPDALVSVVDLCVNLTDVLSGLSEVLPLGQLMQFNDSTGKERAACLITKNFTTQLPLLVWLHPSLAPRNSIVVTGLLEATTTADLTNDTSRLGYHLLIISGRSTPHFYPFPDQVGLGWDNWYRNYNRSDPKMNVDVQTIDYFIQKAQSVATIDVKRVYMSGWSNGAAMAVQYGLNTPNIAAVAAYSAPDPYRDINDPCAQTPYPPYLTPFKILYNQCDIEGICTTGEAFINDLVERYPESIAIFTVTNAAQLYVVSPPICINITSLCGGILLGGLNHLRWPILLNQELFDFLKNYISN